MAYRYAPEDAFVALVQSQHADRIDANIDSDASHVPFVTTAERLTLSRQQLRSFHDEIVRKLPVKGSWRRSIIDWAINSGGAFRGRLISGNVIRVLRHVLGLSQLRVIQVAPAARAGEDEVPAPIRRFFAGLAVFIDATK